MSVFLFGSRSPQRMLKKFFLRSLHKNEMVYALVHEFELPF